MGKTGHIEIDYVANLARIALTPEEKARFSQQLENVLGHIEKLNSVDVEGVEPTAHPFEVSNVWRDDVPGEAFTSAAAMKNAPSTRDDMVAVPKVVDDA